MRSMLKRATLVAALVTAALAAGAQPASAGDEWCVSVGGPAPQQVCVPAP